MTAPVPRPRRPRWHQWWFVGLVAACIVPATIVMFQVAHLARVVDRQDTEIKRLHKANTTQAATLEANGLPTAGVPGTPGTDGQAGTPGANGRDGTDGRDGLSIRGQAGPMGPPGPPGVNGTNGTDGADGAPGRDGASIQGPAGPAGPQGLSGPAGPQGESGPQGPKGDPGEPAVAVQVPDGLGGWCFATDPDGDGVYMCPEAAV